jgi:gliding motility-associated lipoprotein GldH
MYSKYLLLLLFIASCGLPYRYEKKFHFSDHQWDSKESIQFNFHIDDTTKIYKLFLDIHHGYDYLYSNIWVKMTTTYPDQKKEIGKPLEVLLALPDGHWMGSTAHEVAQEHIDITPDGGVMKFPQKGNYKIVLQHIMRDSLLKNIEGIGLQVKEMPHQNLITTP